jgi:hypothetical protein
MPECFFNTKQWVEPISDFQCSEKCNGASVPVWCDCLLQRLHPEREMAAVAPVLGVAYAEIGVARYF